MSQMIFSHDTELTLRAACVLVNTDRVDGEQLGDLAALDAYLDSFGWTGRRDHDDAELKSVHRLRERLGKIWAAADDEDARRRAGQRAAERHQGAAVADPASGDAGMASAPGVDPRPAVAADGRRDGDGAGRPDPRGRAAPAQDLRGARLRGGADRPVAQPLGQCSATPATAATASTSRPTASAARRRGDDLLFSATQVQRTDVQQILYFWLNAESRSESLSGLPPCRRRRGRGVTGVQTGRRIAFCGCHIGRRCEAFRGCDIGRRPETRRRCVARRRCFRGMGGRIERWRRSLCGFARGDRGRLCRRGNLCGICGTSRGHGSLASEAHDVG